MAIQFKLYITNLENKIRICEQIFNVHKSNLSVNVILCLAYILNIHLFVVIVTK